jgi:hypothetical protein
MADPQRPEWGISRAAAEVGVSRDTIKRHLKDGKFPNAFQNDRKVWMIPLTDLLAAGFTPSMHKGTDPVQTESAPEESPSRVMQLEHEIELLRVQLEAEKTLREAVERNSADLRQSLRMIEAAPAPAPAPVTKHGWWKR